jgi:hypothetical protein
MNSSVPYPTATVSPTPWRWVVVGLLPFVWFSLLGLLQWTASTIITMQSGIPPAYDTPAYAAVTTYSVSLTVILSMVLLIIAWQRGFPVWSYPLAIQFFLFSGYASNISIPGFNLFGFQFGHNVLGCTAWVPFVLSIIISLLITRKKNGRPIKTALQGLETDLTRLSFGLYGFSPILLRGSFDGVRDEALFIFAMEIILAVGAVIYMRHTRFIVRMIALLTGLVAIWLPSAIYLAIYWDGRQEAWMLTAESGINVFTSTLFFAFWVVLITMGPWILVKMIQSIEAKEAKQHISQ